MHIERALDPNVDMEEAIVSVPADRRMLDAFGRRLALDLSTREAECGAGMFPLRLVFDPQERARWRRAYENANDIHLERWTAFESTSLRNIDSYKVPVIRLTKETPKEAVCTVFENVNTKGIQLTVFELLTATYAGDPDYFAEHGTDFHLPDEWRATKERLAYHEPVRELDDTDFLRAVCLMSTHFARKGRPGIDAFTQPAASCKRADILTLPLQEYRRWSPEIEAARSGAPDSSADKASSTRTTCRTAARCPPSPRSHRSGRRSGLTRGTGEDHSLVLVRGSR